VLHKLESTLVCRTTREYRVHIPKRAVDRVLRRTSYDSLTYKMGHRRYFIISELDPEKAVESTMGRVIGEAFCPFDYWAPDGLGLPDDDEEYKRWTTQDVIPDILPKPSISMSRKDFLRSDLQPKIFTALVELLNSDLQTDDIHIPLTKFFCSDPKYSGSETKNAQVKIYSLKQPEVVFDRLMENELYAKDTRELLNGTCDKKGYMIIGFVTAEGVLWRDKTKNLGGEEIFAIAYMTVQFKKSSKRNEASNMAVRGSGCDDSKGGLSQQTQPELDVEVSEVDFVDEYRSWEMGDSEDVE
jgi:hypothetical protein